MAESYHQADGYWATDSGHLYPESLNMWSDAIVFGDTGDVTDVVVFARGNYVLRLFVEPCTVDDRSSTDAPRFILEQANPEYTKPWDSERLRRLVPRLKFKAIYRGEDARMVARAVRGSEQLRPLVMEDDRNDIVGNSTYPRVLNEMSLAHIDVTDEDQTSRVTFLTPSGHVLELWVQPACVEARRDNDIGYIFPDDMDIEKWPRFVLNDYTASVDVMGATEEALLDWYDSEDRDDWNQVYAGEDPRELISEFEEISVGQLDWRPSETMPD